MTGLVLKYLENDIGGLANMQKINEAKAKVQMCIRDRAKIVASSKDKNFTYIPDVNAINYDKAVSYTRLDVYKRQDHALL